MKLISKITLVLTFGVACGFGQCVVDQFVNNLPVADVNGAHWTIYDLADPENRVVVEGDPSCITQSIAGGILWTAELGYWSPLPAVGDSLIMIGSWDSAYVNPGLYGDKQTHTGFYWLYSDIVDDVALTHWEDDTLRPLPKPNVYKTAGGPEEGANDTIWVEIPNPRETRYTGQTTVYDVLGYWLWADSTGSGTPNEFNASSAVEIGFIPVDGVYGNTTVYWQLESEDFLPWDHWTTYFAYKLVARPSFSLKGSRQAPGYTTYYFSQNSDAIDVYQIVIGIEENKDINHSSVQLEISPNPFTDRTDIRFQITENQRQDVRSKNQEASLEIYDCSGRLVKSFNLTSVILLHASAVPWYGTDESGKLLPSGVYFIQAKGGDLNLTKKVILQR